MTNFYSPSPSLLGNLVVPVKRKAYFAFHFDDIMRVNNVRNAWKITHPDSPSFSPLQQSPLTAALLFRRKTSASALRERKQAVWSCCA